MAADHVAAEFVAEPERAFEVEFGPRRQCAAVVTCSVSAAASTAKERRFPFMPRSTTVRQTPEQAIEAPISMECGIVTAGNLDPPQPFGLFMNFKDFA